MLYGVGCLLHPVLNGQQLHADGVKDENFDKLKASHPTTADWTRKQQGAMNISDEIAHELLEENVDSEF